MDDAVPWESPPRKSSGMLVGGVILSIAALAAAGFAVKTWVEANQGSAVQSDPLATPETGTTAPESEAVVPSQSQVQPEPTVAPGESPVKPAEQSMPAQEPPASVQPGTGPAAAAPVGWSEAWRTARGLP